MLFRISALRRISTLVLLCMAAVLATLSVPGISVARPVAAVGVTRATLANGLQVVILRDPLAPVVTTMMNYEAGQDEAPIAGLAHAQEHMMFRGSRTLSETQFSEVTALMGGSFDADTQNEITQFYFTVPAQDLDVALHLEASRAQGLLDSQQLWNEERGAIEQEVQQDNSSAAYRLYEKMIANVLAGAPYATTPLGTMQTFSQEINAPQLRAFYEKWYHPNNAILVIAGDVDPQATLAQVRGIFGPIPAKPLPPRKSARLAPFHPQTFTDFSSSPQTDVYLAYRFPGTDSRDYAASQILLDVLNSQRGDLYALVADGKAFSASAFSQTYRQAGMAVVELDVAPSVSPQTAIAQAQGVIGRYLRDGVPSDLVAAAKLREVTSEQFSADSISGLAQEWSQALAAEHRTPDQDLTAIERVTTADVNRVARIYFNAVPTKAYAIPKNNGEVGTAHGQLAGENNTVVPTHHEPLPSWAHGLLGKLRVPNLKTNPTVSLLPNGIRLIVQHEPYTHTVVLRGEIKTAPSLEEKPNQDGVASIASALLGYGTTTYDRIAYQRQLDAIAADVSSGASFSLNVTAQHFSRGVQLLADAQLHPALRPQDFAIVKQQTYEEVASEERSPNHLARVSLIDALYPKGDPTRRRATPATVKSLTLADVREWYRTAYRPDLTSIVVVGDVTPQEARAVVGRWFGGWRASGKKPQLYPKPVADNAAASFTVPATGAVQDTVILAQTLKLRRGEQDVPALHVANAALSGGFYASILFQDLRQRTGYVYYVNTGFNVGKTRSAFEVVYGAEPKNVASADGIVSRDLTQMQRRPLSQERMQVAKALLMGNVATQEESYGGIAGVLLADSVDDLPLDQQIREARAELAATPRQVQAAMARWVRPRGFAQVIVGPSP